MAVLGGALLGLGLTTWVGTAHAQEEYVRSAVPAPSDAFELKVGSHYTQGFGEIAPGKGIPSVAGAGVDVDLAFDYRIDPMVSFGVQGEYQQFESEQNSEARGFTGNIGLTFHGTPNFRGDPWLRLATGYRLLWSVQPEGGGPTTLYHGFELARLMLGYDVRVTPDVAIAPAVGAGVDLFLWQDQNGTNSSLSPATVGMFIFAGLQGRFDAGGVRSTPGATVVADR